MSPLFGKKKSSGKNTARTFLVIDVENGSVASALAHLSPGELPKLYGSKRISIRMLQQISTERLAYELNSALTEVLAHAAYLYANSKARVEKLSGAVVFLGAPWSTLSQSSNQLQWEFEPELLPTLKHTIESHIAPHLIQFHSFGNIVASTTTQLISGILLTCVVTGEVTELILSDNERVIGRATVPIGTHTILRTLQSHAGANLAEAQSLLRLLRDSGEHPFSEALDAAAARYATEFSVAAYELLQKSPTNTVFIIAPHPIASWLARSLSKRVNAVEIFPQGGAIRALQPHHLEKYVSTHPTNNDLALMLEVMFINSLYTPTLTGV